MQFNRRELVQFMRDAPPRKEAKQAALLEVITAYCSDSDINLIKRQVSQFCADVYKRLPLYHRNYNRLLESKTCATWLDADQTFGCVNSGNEPMDWQSTESQQQQQSQPQPAPSFEDLGP